MLFLVAMLALSPPELPLNEVGNWEMMIGGTSGKGQFGGGAAGGPSERSGILLCGASLPDEAAEIMVELEKLTRVG